jgi:hypothetical protein
VNVLTHEKARTSTAEWSRPGDRTTRPAEGAEVVLTGRNPERLKQAGLDLGAQSTAAFDANDPVALDRFFADLPTPIDHVMVSVSSHAGDVAASAMVQK